MKSIALILTGLLFLTASCFGVIRERKAVITENRTVGAFQQLKINGPFKTTVTIGSPASVQIIAEENLMPFCKTEVVNGVLRVSLDKPSVSGFNTLEANITVDVLTSVEINGAARLLWNGPMKTDQWTLNVGGASKFETSSPLSFKTCKMNAGGASKITMDGKLTAEDLTISANGASRVIASVEAVKTAISVNGASSMTASGKSKELNARISGASRLSAEEFICEIIDAEATGASSASVHATQSVIGKENGASNLRISGNPTHREIRR